MKSLLLALFVVSLILNSKVDESVNGQWSLYCDSTTSIYKDDTGGRILTVLTSQIYVNVNYEKTSKARIIEIYYDGIKDLGGGEVRLGIDWGSLSKKKPIALFKVESDSEAILTWYGFVDLNGRKVDVVSDFSTEAVNKLERCR